MKSRWFLRFLLGLAFLTVVAPVAAQGQAPPASSSSMPTRPSGPATARPQPPLAVSPFLPGFWWRDYRKTLGLTEEQSRRIDTIVENTMPIFRQKGSDLRAQEEELSRLIMTDVDEGAIAKQADHVETLRAMLNKNRTLMLVRIRAVLTPEQRAKLTALRAQWEQENQSPRQGPDRDRQSSDRDRRPPTPRADPPRTPR